MDADFRDRPLELHPLRATREASLSSPRRPSTFNDQDPTTTRLPSVATRAQESEFSPPYHKGYQRVRVNISSVGRTRASPPSPPSQDTAPISAPQLLPAHLPSVNPNYQRRMPRRREFVVQRPRRQLLRRTNKVVVDEGVFCGQSSINGTDFFVEPTCYEVCERNWHCI